MIDVRMFTVGGVQENCFFVRGKGSNKALIIDPGDEPERLVAAIEQLGIEQVAGILVTHTHFDHIGAVAPVAAASGAQVWCPEIEVPVLANIMDYVPWPGFGPYESYDADHTVKGGETLELAGLTLDVLFTPGHSPGHVTYAVRDENALFSGDVPTLLQSIESLLDAYPEEATVYPGHGPLTTLGRERAGNPFLRELSAER
jgi:glyoxylase-like metal-dependent hydrolase (beta-lactamase superfamily II)